MLHGKVGLYNKVTLLMRDRKYIYSCVWNLLEMATIWSYQSIHIIKIHCTLMEQSGDNNVVMQSLLKYLETHSADSGTFQNL